MTNEIKLRDFNEVEKQCKEFNCPNFKIWEYYHTNYSCTLLGESDDIEAIPLNCPFYDKFKHNKNEK